MNDDRRLFPRGIPSLLIGAAIASVGASSCAGHDAGGSSSGPGTTTLTPAAQAVPACSQNLTQVATNVRVLAAGGGALAYLQGASLFVLPASEQTPVQIGVSTDRSRQPSALAVDDTFVAYSDWGDVARTSDPATGQWLMVVDYRNGTTAKLGEAALLRGPQLSAHRAFWGADDSVIGATSATVWNALADGTGAPSMTTRLGPEGAGMLNAAGNTVAWLDDGRVLWTVRADRNDPPTRHAVMPSAGLTFYGTTVYVGDSTGLVALPIDGGPSTRIATALPTNYPVQDGALSLPGPTNVVVGPRRIFWVEAWGNGGAGPPPSGQILNWVIRAVAVTGGEPEIVDSFTWHPGATTFGTAPQIATDGVGVYWTHEGTLMRLCE